MKFEMNHYTLGMIKRDGLVCNPPSLIERKYSFHDIPIVINTNKPDGIVQLGRNTVDLTHTDNIRGSLESLIFAAKRREGVKMELSSAYGSFERASGRTFRALLEVMKTASESPEGSLTVFVSLNETSKNVEYRKLVNMLSYSVQGVDGCFSRKSVMLPGDRRIMIITKNQSSKITEPCQVIYDHTVQRGE